jgi:hypothetical protein
VFVTGAVIRRQQIVVQNIYVHVRDLKIRIRMMNARAFQVRPVTHYSGFLVSHVHIKAFGGNFFAVAIHDKI